MSKDQKRIIDYYILIHAPNHPKAFGIGYVPEQILVAEKELGRYLSDDEDVRHINGDCHDNRPTNLEIISVNSGYKTQSISGDDFSDKRATNQRFMSCKFQKPCWRDIRAPLARKNKIYLPWICSYQSEGDIYKCGHFWNYIDTEMEKNREEE